MTRPALDAGSRDARAAWMDTRTTDQSSSWLRAVVGLIVAGMRLQLEWGRQVPLVRSKLEAIYTVDLDKFYAEAGVYVFARQWGSGFEALYVGKADNIRRRVRGQLNNLRLMKHVEGAKTGKRVVLPGYAVTRPGQRMPTVLTTLERALIRHFLSEGHDLVNKMGVRIRRHEIDSIGAPRRFLPSMMYLER